MKERRTRICVLLASAMVPVITACAGSGSDSGSKGHKPPGPGDIPEAVAVAASAVTSGVYLGPMRRVDDVGAFRIAKHPVTVAQFQACVAAGACSESQERACIAATAGAPFDRATTEVPGGAALPATCVGVKQARAFCEWVGGTLPTLPQFFVAARGQRVARFAWGNTPPACGQRPDGIEPSKDHPAEKCENTGDPLREFAVAGHPKGASPVGVEDVLLSPGELVAVSTDAYTTACVPPFGACVAYGIQPGAIDGFEPLSAVDEAVARNSYGFRCVWN